MTDGRDEQDTICPATACPYLGLVDGSPWTGEEAGPCETSCGWYHDDHCSAGREYDIDVHDVVGPVPPRDLWPACPYSDECQWQAQRDGPCGPRRLLMFGKTIDEVVML